MPSLAQLPRKKPKRIGRPPRNGGEEMGGIRDALLAAATAEFASHGFAGARVGHICREAGTTVRMVYDLQAPQAG